MRNLSLRHIETLQAIAAAGSLVQAAATLNMTPAALTARVKGLEDAVGLKLFDRTSTGMRLTKAGEAALEASRGVERAMRDFADAMLAISDRRGRPAVRRRDVDREIFRPAAHRGFCRQPAEGRSAASRSAIATRPIESLRSGEIEIALAGRPPRDMPVETFPLGPHPYVLIAPPEHRFAGAQGLDAGRSRRRSVPVPRDRLRHALAVRRLHRRHERSGPFR